ncbi:MAG: hypothetical protein ACRDQF_09425, partial [Thermocrispum sp.]
GMSKVRATGEAFIEAGKAGGAQVLKSTIGIDPRNAPENPLQAGRVVAEAGDKIIDNVSNLDDMSDKGRKGDQYSADETRNNLEM